VGSQSKQLLSKHPRAATYSVFGKGKACRNNDKFWKALIRQAAGAPLELLQPEQMTTSNGVFTTYGLTPKAFAFLDDAAATTPPFEPGDELAEITRRTMYGGGGGGGGGGGSSSSSSSSSGGSKSKKGATNDALLEKLTPAQKTLYERLKAVRLKFATAGNMPAFSVFNNKSLVEMAERAPTGDVGGCHPESDASSAHLPLSPPSPRLPRHQRREPQQGFQVRRGLYGVHYRGRAGARDSDQHAREPGDRVVRLEAGERQAAAGGRWCRRRRRRTGARAPDRMA